MIRLRDTIVRKKEASGMTPECLFDLNFIQALNKNLDSKGGVSC